MSIRLLFFAGLREALGLAREDLILSADVRSLGDLRAFLAGRGGVWAQQLAPGRNLRAAVNQDMAAPEAALKDGDEVAFFPPVTGG